MRLGSLSSGMGTRLRVLFPVPWRDGAEYVSHQYPRRTFAMPSNSE